MIEVSELAAMALLETLEASGIDPDKGLRLKQENDQFTLQIDRPVDSDRIIWHEKAIVLIVDRDVEREIGDALIDVEDGDEGPDLTIRRRWQG